MDTIKVRIGIIIVGPAAFGKSSILDVVRKTITNLAEESEDDSYYRKV